MLPVSLAMHLLPIFCEAVNLLQSAELHQIVSLVSTATESPHLLHWKEHTTALENPHNSTGKRTKETFSDPFLWRYVAVAEIDYIDWPSKNHRT